MCNFCFSGVFVRIFDFFCLFVMIVEFLVVLDLNIDLRRGRRVEILVDFLFF